MRLLSAFLSAVIFPTLLIVGWYLYGQFSIFESDDPYIWVRTRNFLLLVLMISTGYVVLLGIPAFYLLKKLNVVRWWSTIGVGFILGALPMAILTWPLNYSGLKTSSSSNGVQTMIDGVPTMAGWLEFFTGVSFLGACGFLGALAFWVVAPNKLKQFDAQKTRASA